MANLKNITELPMAESADGLNLIVNDNGAAKQIAASAVSVQADWNQNDPTRPDYVKNRPFYEAEDGEVHKIPEKYLPDGIGGAGNVMVIYLNEGDPENQVYPEGLYDTIDRMMKNNFFDTVIMAIGHGEGDYDIYFYSAVHIYKEGDNYVLQLKANSRKIFIYVRPDNSGWMG